MIVLVQDKGPTKSDPPVLAEAIEILRGMYGAENLTFDLEMKPYQEPVLMAYYVKDGQSTLLGPVR